MTWGWLALAGVLAWMARDAVAASSILIWPINPSIEGEHKAAALWLENRGEKPVSLQVRILDWSQAQYADVLAAQQGVVGSPPVTRVEPGKQQMVRLILRQPVEPGRERAYRILVDEMLTPESAEDPRLGIKFQMRYSVPLFVVGSGAQVDLQGSGKPGLLRPELHYRFAGEGGARYLLLRNVGTAHARLSAVRLRQGNASYALSEGLLGYVLPGVEMRWPLPPEVPAGGGVLEARVNDGEQPQPLVAD
ncbi:molecular chaperone [Pseudomonas sp. RIT-PI-AD]|uniref:fimbrial biogenesis chaperone n=1 Tax=Pseudomonas sp. RIT-PI-AD TaxID=3035294 RepID=UPI0021D88797|nr:molecular chaperone [Pseudomonas sp. RIT-PI-AD]